jgi:predicted PurR-regulated permease PerM
MSGSTDTVTAMTRAMKNRVAGLKHPQAPPAGDVTGLVPRGLRVAAAVSWRFLIVIAGLYVILWLFGYFFQIMIPLAIALLLAALMAPGVDKLSSWGVPRSISVVAVLIGGLAAVGGILTFVIIQFIDGLPQLQSQVANSLDQIHDWLLNGPLHIKDEQITSFLNNTFSSIKQNQSAITSGALTTAATIGEVLTGLLLTLFILIFFLYDGRAIWHFLVRGVPHRVRDRVDLAGRRGFAALVSFVRATVAVALFDAVFIGIGLQILGVPLVVPLAALVFLGAFIPIIGAVIAGTVAVLIALVTKSFVTALIVLAIIIGIMQIEGHILQPWLLGRAVKLHPLAVVLAIAAGLTAAGIAGALLAVPLLAVVNAGVRSLLHDHVAEPGEVNPVEEPTEAAEAEDI